jgi:hypothetical protein
MARNQPITIPTLEGDGTITIPVTGSAGSSNHIDMRRMPLRGITIFGPAVLTGTVTVEVSADLDAATPTWQKLQSGGANIAVGAAEAVSIDYVAWHGLRVASASAEASPRVFKILGVEDL